MKESLLGLDSWIAAAEEVSLQTASEGGKRRCGRDVLRQKVPNTGCSDWKRLLNLGFLVVLVYVIVFLCFSCMILCVPLT